MHADLGRSLEDARRLVGAIRRARLSRFRAQFPFYWVALHLPRANRSQDCYRHTNDSDSPMVVLISKILL